MRKIVIIFICILCLSSCFPNEKFSKYNEKNKELIEEYITPISTGYKNDDGTKTLIVYSYPIRFYKNNKLIDIDISLVKKNDIYTVKEGNIVPEISKILDKNKNILIISDHTLKYRFDGIDKVKGKKKIKNDYVNISREMIEYDNIFGENTELNIYPTYFGTNNEIQLDSLK